MKVRTFYSFSTLAIALSMTAAVAGAQTRTSTVVCNDGARVGTTRECFVLHGGVNQQATRDLQTYGRYGSNRAQTQTNGSWKVGSGQGNGSWKVGGQNSGQSDGRYDTRGNGRYDRRDGRYDRRDDRYDRRDDRRDDRYDSRSDRRRDDGDDDDQGDRADRGRGRGDRHDNGKHLGWYKNGKHKGRD